MNYFILIVLLIGCSFGDLIGYNRGQNNVNLHILYRNRMTRRFDNYDQKQRSDKKSRSEMYKLLVKYLSEP